MVNELCVTDRFVREFSPLLEKVMKGSVGIALRADILRGNLQTVLEGQKQQRQRRKNSLVRVRGGGGSITVGTGRKIDAR
jgi:hypothetical protein